MTGPLTAERSSARASSARTVLQITDTHLQAPSPSATPATLLGVDTADSLAAVLDQALAEHTADAVIASGDLAHAPAIATYARFRDLLQSRYQGPVLHLAGNHDLGEPFRQVLGSDDSLRLGGWEVLCFDTHVDHETEASFDDAQRRMLAARIEESAADHVMLACHHHPLPVGCPWLDKDRIPAGDELLEFCAAPELRVRGLIFGHVHQQFHGSSQGLRVLGTPSTCFQFEPGSERFAIDRDPDTGRPGYRWLWLHEDGTVTTEVRRLEGYHLNIDLSDRS